EVDDDRFLPAAHDDGLHRHIRPCVEFLMRQIRRHEHEIAWSRLVHKFQPLAPAKPCAPSDNVDHGFEFPVMMWASLGIRMNYDGACPELLRPDARAGNCFGA